MNKDLDFKYHQAKYRELVYKPNRRSQRHVLHARVHKLSLPQADQIYTQLGKAFFNPSFPNSIFLFKKATIINPKNIIAQVELAKAFSRLGKPHECFDSLKKALSLNRKADELHNLLIMELQERDRLKDLEAFYKEIENMIVDPESVASFYFECAEALGCWEMYAQAILAYRKAMENSPTMTSELHYHYGVALYNEGQFEEAIVQFEQVKKLDPSVKQAWSNIAQSNYCLGRVQKAREEFWYIIQNGMETKLTNSNFLLVLLHLDEEEELINKCKDAIEQSIVSDRGEMSRVYERELEVSQALLDRNDIDEKLREFNKKKLKAINFLLSFITERSIRKTEEDASSWKEEWN